MLIFDDEKVMFPLEQPIKTTKDLTMIYIEHKQLAAACRILFDYMWNSGIDFGEIEKNYSIKNKVPDIQRN